LPYYFNATEKNSRWEPPPGTDVEKLKVYMAKYHSNSGMAAGGGADAGKIRAAHLLVKHAESRRPSSWREVRRLYTLMICIASVADYIIGHHHS
jgi:NIMA-interacting peptidyl-prolyl cis-trans isomerase 1